MCWPKHSNQKFLVYLGCGEIFNAAGEEWKGRAVLKSPVVFPLEMSTVSILVYF